MYSISANRNKIAYDVKRFVIDFTSDIPLLPKDCAAGSTAFIIENSTRYMLNSNGQWVLIRNSGSGGEGGDDVITDVIYDGGVI
jgi:hypothetical protein